MLIYEDLSTELRAKRVLEHAARQVPMAPNFNLAIWRFDVLREASLREKALNEASVAVIVLVSAQGCEVFSFKQPTSEELSTIFFGARPAVCRNASGSASSIAPSTRRCSSSACIRRFSEVKGFRMSCSTRSPYGKSGIVPSWTWRSISTVTAPGLSRSSSTCRRMSNESDSSSGLMSLTRTGNSALRHSREEILAALHEGL